MKGLVAANAVNGFLQGLEVVERMEDRDLQRQQLGEEKAWRGEVRQQQRKSWDDAAKRNRYGKLIYEFNGVDLDQPENMGRFVSRAKEEGLDLDRYRAKEMDEYLSVFPKVAAGEIDRNDPNVLRLVNWRYADEINQGSGTPLETDIDLGDGRVVPKGSVITGKKVAAILPAPDGKSIVMDLEVSAKDDAGNVYTWNAPPTVGRRAGGPNDEVITIPVARFFDHARGDALLARAMKNAPRAVEAEFVGVGGDPSSFKKKDFSEREALAKLDLIDARTGLAKEQTRIAGRNTDSLIRYRDRLGSAAEERARNAGKTASGRRSAQIEYADFVAQNKFGGDVGKALDWIKGGNAAQIAAGIAKAMFAAQEKNRKTRGTRTFNDIYNDALTTIRGIQDDPGAVAAAGQDAATPAEAAELEEDFSALWGE
jgi:hypothetical protein